MKLRTRTDADFLNDAVAALTLEGEPRDTDLVELVRRLERILDGEDPRSVFDVPRRKRGPRVSREAREFYDYLHAFIQRPGKPFAAQVRAATITGQPESTIRDQAAKGRAKYVEDVRGLTDERAEELLRHHHARFHASVKRDRA